MWLVDKSQIFDVLVEAYQFQFNSIYCFIYYFFLVWINLHLPRAIDLQRHFSQSTKLETVQNSHRKTSKRLNLLPEVTTLTSLVSDNKTREIGDIDFSNCHMASH